MIGSLIVGELLEVFKRKSILLLGLISMAFELVLFGLTTYLSSNYETAVISLLIRGFQGVSASMIMTTSYAIVTIVYKENQQQYLGFLESSQGLGLIVGPMIGSTLYTFIGFECTFYWLGLVFAILSIALLLISKN